MEMFKKWILEQQKQALKYEKRALKYRKRMLEHRFHTLYFGTLAGGVLALLVGNFLPYLWSYDFFFFLKNGRLISSLIIIFLVLPVLTLLWFFRTHDTKTQIDKAEANIQTNMFFKAQEMLLSPENSPLGVRRRVVGLIELLRLKRNGLFVESINVSTSTVQLTKADLRGTDLSGANLRGADLSGANLMGADLRGANLSGAVLSAASLNMANLSRADLRWANLSKADLSGAKLIGANLNGANLNGADLRGVDLREAINLNNATFINAKYSKGKKTPTHFTEGFDPEAHGMQLAE